MPKSQNPNSPLGPLSVGNVVSGGLRIYRDRFKLYYPLAFRAYLWILVPIYGWAKFSAILGLISRLVFSEIIERPETVNEARRHVNPRLWNFFLAGLLVGLILLGALLGTGIILGIVFVALGLILPSNPFLILIAIIALIAVIFGYIWLYSHLSIVELPIAIEENVDAASAINRSWILTKGYVFRLQLIFFIAFLITLPISFLVQVASSIIQLLLATIFPQDSAIFGTLYALLSLMIVVAGGALLIPFWQAIKAIIYYDLRSRKEGLDLQIRDS
jgi:hypothetical protein